jgi:hypothetical protein
MTALLASCSTDHEHFMGDYYYDGPYYYRDGYYYSDPDYRNPYNLDVNHYYYGRLEWKGENVGYAIVLREPPFFGFICDVNDDQVRHILRRLEDRDVMVRFNWYAGDRYGYPYMNVLDIYYR